VYQRILRGCAILLRGDNLSAGLSLINPIIICDNNIFPAAGRSFPSGFFIDPLFHVADITPSLLPLRRQFRVAPEAGEHFNIERS
jgi:hypothetical protein